MKMLVDGKMWFGKVSLAGFLLAGLARRGLCRERREAGAGAGAGAAGGRSGSRRRPAGRRRRPVRRQGLVRVSRRAERGAEMEPGEWRHGDDALWRSAIERGIRRLPGPRRMGFAVGRERQRPRKGQQRRLPHGPLRDPNTRQLQQPDLLQRPVRGLLRAQRPVGQCLPQARRMANLRHHLSRSQALPDGKVQPGSFTVLQNGVLIQDHIPVDGQPTRAAPLHGIAEKGPLYLQDHGNPVRFRNVWVRRL